MIDQREIPYLVKLLDDDSLEIRERVAQQLASFGPTLKEEVQKLNFPFNPIQLQYLHRIFQGQKVIWLKRHWSRWFYLKNDYEKLESALSILSEFLHPKEQRIKLRDVLDSLAEIYRGKFRTIDERQLSHFLFKEKGLKGNEQDYYNPQNSNLMYVIQEKKGIPISLASVYLLVGNRLGLRIEGCNFPGHFLARIESQGKKYFVDCFNSGRVIEAKDIIRVRKDLADEIKNILYERIDAEAIIRRFLTNLITAYQIRENEEGRYMVSLFKDLDAQLMQKEIQELTPDQIIADTRPLFKIGQVVRHKTYGYRAIIVDVDMFCKFPSKSEANKQSEESRNQPWFHVLVDSSDQVNYVCESNLEEDNSKQRIEHPLLSYFFTQSRDGEYVRNANPWPHSEI